jgi:solute carrier family 25 thiamine pyrophosphate transporter 19
MNNNNNNSNSPTIYPAWHNAVAGGTAGAASRLLTAPLDLVRIRRQLAIHMNVSTSLTVNTTSNNTTTLNIWNTWRNMIRNEGGMRALFRGNAPATYLWIGYAAVQFSIYKPVRDFVIRKQAQFDQQEQASSTSTIVATFIAGGVAGTCATVVTYPLDLCRTARAVPGHGTTWWQVARHLYQRRGVGRGLYAGARPAVVQIIPYMGLNFSIYEVLLTRECEDHRVDRSACAGAVSGAVSKSIVYPLDTVKRRMQGQALYHVVDGSYTISSSSSSLKSDYASMRDCIHKLWTREGIVSFYRGIVPSVLKSTISSALSFAFFRLTKNALEGLHHQGEVAVS